MINFFKPKNTETSEEQVLIQNISAELEQLEERALEAGVLTPAMNRLRHSLEKLFGAQSTETADLHRLGFDLPANPVEAILQLAVRKVVNIRMLNKWYENRFVLLINSEKSSSTLHEVAIREMMTANDVVVPNFGITRGVKYGPTEFAYQSLHGAIMHYAPDGGIIRGPFSPSFGNKRIADELGAKVIILCRHPADRLVARACMREGTVERPQGVSLNEIKSGAIFSEFISDHFSPLSLLADLTWLAGWYEYAESSSNCMIFRYEELLENPHVHFSNIHQFIFNTPMSDEHWGSTEEIIKASREGQISSGERDKRSYPFGYSGQRQIWKKYFTEQNVRDYNNVVRNICADGMIKDNLLKVYPDLLLPENE